ncbi:MAG: hypothetical protein J6K33_09815 [Alistipes sp.]|nr:hypothetical protein [Alistipes sp.]
MRNFYAIFKGVLSTLVLTAMVAVSCTEPYDDTQIRQEIADLYEKVSKLEEKLNSEVAALKTLIDEKTVVASATKNNDGSWEILLTSGEKITVYPQYQPEPQAPEVNNGCVTVIKDGDVYVWAQIIDGKAVAITDAAGNKIPVAHNATPEFRVNPATGDVELSVDGGHTWVVVEKAEQEETPEPTCIFTGVVDGESSVDFTLANGEVISVPKAETIDFGVQAGKTFVTPGESVDVALKAENIDDLTVIAKPEGWKATISGKTLTVTAPAQEKLDAGEAELEGLVKIHAAGGDGKCMVGKLLVSASTASVLLEVVGDNVTLYNNTGLRWSGVSYGIAAYDEFSAEAIAKAKNNYELMAYELYETQATVSVKQMYNEMIAQVYDPASYVDVPTGTSYVIWALAGSDAWDHVYSADEVVYTVYTPAFLNVESTAVTFNSVEISAVGGGYAGYIVGVVAAASADEAKMQIENSFGNWQMGWGMFGAELKELNYKGDILGFGDAYYPAVYPNTTYVVYILPLVDGKAESEYLVSDLKTYSFTTPNIEAGGSATLAFEALETTYSNIEVAIKGSENTTMIYSVFATADEFAAYKTDEELIQYVIEYNSAYNMMTIGNESTAYISSLNPGDAATVLAFAVDTEGKYSKLYKQEFKTNTLAYNTMKVNIDVAASKVDVNTASIKVSTEGGTPVSYRYIAVDTTGYSWQNEATTETQLALDSNWNVQTIAVADVVDGYINLTDLTTNNEYAFGIVAIDAEGNPSHATFHYFTPSLPEYPIIRSTNDAYAAMVPTVESVVAWNSDYGAFDVTVTVTPAAGTTKYWVAVWDSESAVAPDSPAKDIIDNLMLKEGQYYGSVSGTEAATFAPSYKAGRTYDVKAVVYVAWCDAAGNYYEAVQKPIFTAPYIASTEAAWTASEPTVEATLEAGVLTYTVTPGAGAAEIYVLAVPNKLYYDDDDLTYALPLHTDAVKSTTAVSGTLENVPEQATVAVAWKDAEGNIYQVKKVEK